MICDNIQYNAKDAKTVKNSDLDNFDRINLSHISEVLFPTYQLL